MARSLKQRFDEALDKYGELIRVAFLAAVNEITSRVIVRAVVERLEANDIDGAIAAMHIERAAFIALEDALYGSYQAGGAFGAEMAPTLSRILVRFDVRNPVAEAWLRQHSADLVTGIVDGQRSGIRQVLTEGMAAGRNPTSTALDVVGRVSRSTGRREGGILGLTDQQSGFVANARDELASGDPVKLRNYLKRERRDKRFDRAVANAIKTGKALPKDTVDAATGKYADKLLKLRGDMIGRTETLTSMNAAAHEGFRQGLAKTNYGEDMVIRTWQSAGDAHVRHTHQVLNGQKVRGLSRPYVSPSGARMLYPGDRSLGAPVSELAGCRCREHIAIDYFGEHRGIL